MERIRQSFLRGCACVLIAFGACAASSVRADQLADAVRVMAATTASPDRVDLVVHLLTSGHATFVTREGERSTVSTFSVAADSSEVARVLDRLAPRDKARSIRFYLTEETAFAPGDDVFRLRVGERRWDKAHAIIDGSAYPATVIRQVPTAGQAHNRLAVVIAEGRTLFIESAAAFKAARAVLSRPTPASTLRLVALDGPPDAALPAVPMRDQADTVQVDRIGLSPLRLTQARGQAIMVMGRLQADDAGEPNRLVVRREGGVEVALPLTDIETAAGSADATMLVLNTVHAVQPGGRNVLWLPVTPPALSKTMPTPTLIDLVALAVGSKPIGFHVKQSAHQLQITVLPEERGASLSVGRWLDNLSTVVGDLLGRSPARSAVIYAPLPARQAELDRRLIKGLPSWLQFGYAGLLLLGLLGLPTAWRWFARVWPLETASDYANTAGWHAASAVRAVVFAVVFMPLAAIVAAPAQLFRLMRRPA